MSSPFARATVTSGLLVTGTGMTMPAITTGCRALGARRRRSASSGPQGGGAGVVVRLSSTRVAGVRRWVATAESIMDSVTSAWVLPADVGTMDISFITAQWRM